MKPGQQNEQTLWGFLRAEGRKTMPEYEDYDRYIKDITKLRVGCAVFMFAALVAFAVGVSLFMGPQG